MAEGQLTALCREQSNGPSTNFVNFPLKSGQTDKFLGAKIQHHSFPSLNRGLRESEQPFSRRNSGLIMAQDEYGAFENAMFDVYRQLTGAEER